MLWSKLRTGYYQVVSVKILRQVDFHIGNSRKIPDLELSFPKNRGPNPIFMDVTDRIYDFYVFIVFKLKIDGNFRFI